MMTPTSAGAAVSSATISTLGDVPPIVSVVVPAFNEAENIPLLYQRVGEVLEKMVAERWELIFVDDGSRDATWAMICSLAANDPKVLGVRLSRNFGHQFALFAGLETAQGEGGHHHGLRSAASSGNASRAV